MKKLEMGKIAVLPEIIKIEKMKLFILTLFSLITLGSLNVNAQDFARNVAEYNLTNGVALKGYDPVSYFPEGGGNPLKGITQLKLNYLGVTYFFANSQNLDLFVENPDKYEPTYGGFCAFAMASGTRVDIQPSFFTIHGNRLHFFVSKRAKQNFDSDIAGFETKADSFWKQISGEEPRL